MNFNAKIATFNEITKAHSGLDYAHSRFRHDHNDSAEEASKPWQFCKSDETHYFFERHIHEQA